MKDVQGSKHSSMVFSKRKELSAEQMCRPVASLGVACGRCRYPDRPFSVSQTFSFNSPLSNSHCTTYSSLRPLHRDPDLII